MPRIAAPESAPPRYVEAAERLLAFGGYEWLFTRAGQGAEAVYSPGATFYSIGDITQHLVAAGLRNSRGSPVGREAIENWVERIAAAAPQYVQQFSQQFGVRVSHYGLVLWFAGMLEEPGRASASG